MIRTVEEAAMAVESASSVGHRGLGFQTLEQQTRVERLTLEGTLPSWLRGTLIRVTPAMLDVGGRQLRHWFDGLAMLNAFSFADGHVGYANRYLDTEVCRRAREGRADFAGFAQDPCRSIFRRVATMFSGQAVLNDNANINLTRLGERYVAMTELPIAVEFDAETLESDGEIAWNDRLSGQITTAHPHYDPTRRELLNYVAHLGPRSSYRLFAVADGTTTRREIARVPVRKPAYMHSFGMSEHYLILAEFPLVVEPLRLALSGRAFIDNYRWEPDRGTRFIVVDRASGAVRGTLQTDPFFAFHHVAAFEHDAELVVDVCAYDDPEIIWSLELARLRSDEPRSAPAGELRRYRLPLSGGAVSREQLCEAPLELPRINYARANGRNYHYVYGTGLQRPESDWLDLLVKVDVRTGETRTWRERGCYPGEPVFVAAPGAGQAGAAEAARATRAANGAGRANGEDAGAVLSVVLDSRAGRSFLLILDAASFEERARAEAPHPIPFGFHGQFFGAS
jgi:beta,beta-carotene 9',10'-dioxygenase